MQTVYGNLSENYIDIFREIGSIGAGNAATSLSVMLGHPVHMVQPQVRLVSFDEAADLCGGAETLTFGVILELIGDVEGMMLFLHDRSSVHLMLNALMGEQFGGFEELSDMALSALEEVGNILAGAYVRSLSALTDLDIGIGTPASSIDMAGALLSVPLTRFGALDDRVFMIDGAFTADTLDVSSALALFAEPGSLELILSKLGLL